MLSVTFVFEEFFQCNLFKRWEETHIPDHSIPSVQFCHFMYSLVKINVLFVWNAIFLSLNYVPISSDCINLDGGSTRTLQYMTWWFWFTQYILISKNLKRSSVIEINRAIIITGEVCWLVAFEIGFHLIKLRWSNILIIWINVICVVGRWRRRELPFPLGFLWTSRILYGKWFPGKVN